MATPFIHQVEASKFIFYQDGGMLAYGVGTGKTFITLTTFKERWLPQGYKLLVICPLTLIHEAWERDNETFTQLRLCNMRKKDRSEADIYVTNFETLLSANKRAEIIGLLRKYKFVCAVDESSRVSNPMAKTTKYLLSLGCLMPIKIDLSGTPNSQSDLQWWAQMNFVKPGVLPGSFFAFRNTYFHLERGGQKLPPGPIPKDVARQLFSKGWKYAITPKKRKMLMDKIGPYIRWKKLDECVDMPPEVDQIRPVIMGEDQARSYKMMKQECITEIREQLIPATTALTKLVKLRTITSGFAYTPEGDAVRFTDNPKLDELKEVLDELGHEKVVVFCNFRAEIEDIKGLLGDRCVTVDGETDDKSEAIAAFRSGQVQYLIANAASISHGVTLIEARYMVFYSHSYSAEKFTQARARIRRIGQKGACVYIHLIAEDTIDQVILDVLKNKQDAVEIVRKMMS